MRKVFLLSALMMVAGLVTAQDKDIVEIAKSSGNHTVLVRAIMAADLDATLKDKGPYTVFAPTNEAFEKLPKGALKKLLEEENKPKLRNLLKYHVVKGQLDAAKVMEAAKAGNDSAMITTVQGEKLTIAIVDGKVQITDMAGGTAIVTATDLKGSNGIVHVIDSVLMPKAKKK